MRVDLEALGAVVWVLMEHTRGPLGGDAGWLILVRVWSSFGKGCLIFLIIAGFTWLLCF